MKYRILMGMSVDARSDQEAHAFAEKLAELLKEPFVQISVQGKGIRLSGDGEPVVHQPQRE